MLVKHNNNSISELTTVNLAQGKMTLISSQTASGSASIEFTTGIDSTYPIYRFEFINLHPQTDNQWIRMTPSINGGTDYNAVNSTSSHFRAWHNETDSSTSLTYYTDGDLAQSTDGQILCTEVGNGNDNSACGTLFLFNPSSTTFVKHYISNFQVLYNASAGYSMNNYVGGYINSTSPVNAIKFTFNSGNIDSGKIKLYGIGD
jgi:hypothetical protein